jgi:serralysin
VNIRKLALSAAVSGLALSVASVSYAAEDGDRGHVNRPGPEVEAPEVGDPAEISFDDFAGGSFASKPIVDLDQVITQIDRGLQESANGGMITFSFLKMDHLTGLYNNPNYGFTAGNGVGPLNDGQRAAARDAIAYWDDLIAPRFVEKNGVGADIRFANSADPAQAYAYYPNDANGWKFRSDVFIADPELNWTNNWVNFNGYGLTAVVHEIGHSQGLSHPGAYNFTPGVPLTYANNAEYAQDSEQYSIMSYWAPSSTQAILIDYSYFLFGNAQTPMVHDILTIQSKYGADTTTRTGDTVYGFNSTAGRDVFDFALNPWPNF